MIDNLYECLNPGLGKIYFLFNCKIYKLIVQSNSKSLTFLNKLFICNYNEFLSYLPP